MKPKPIILNLVFLLVALLVLIATITGTQWLKYVSMPLVMITIAFIFLVLSRKLPGRSLVITAFFFSWVGDILLMIVSKNEMLFFGGVGGFFLSQVTYIIAFSKYAVEGSQGYIRQKPILLLPYLIYLIGVFGYLYPHLETFMVPVVLLYAASLLGMSISALNRRGRMDASGFNTLFVGSLFFVASDTMLAVNKFATPIPHQDILVLSTYAIAQFLIMQGLVKASQNYQKA